MKKKLHSKIYRNADTNKYKFNGTEKQSEVKNNRLVEKKLQKRMGRVKGQSVRKFGPDISKGSACRRACNTPEEVNITLPNF